MSVSEIGYGAWGIGASGWVGATEDESVRALHRAVDLGVNFIDTARGYGESERIVGRVVRERTGDEVLVATKVPPMNRIWPAPDEIAENALRFVLSSPAVSTVIPGMRTVRNVERNTALSDGRPLTAHQLAVLAGHRWQRNFYG
jgi:aryl-alcohol dehydrogenase-like predicted oxidoreductase